MPESTSVSAVGSRVPPAAPAARTSPSSSKHERRRHHRAHPLAGDEVADDEVDLAEHAVQVQVEPGEEVAAAEAEARRERARVPVVVDDADVRRVRLGAAHVEHAARPGARAPSRSARAAARRRGSRSGSFERPPRVRTRVPDVLDLERLAPDRPRSRAGRPRVTIPPRARISESTDCASEPVYIDARALGDEERERLLDPRLAQRVARLQQHVLRRVDPRAASPSS